MKRLSKKKQVNLSTAKRPTLKFLSTGKSAVDYQELRLYVENGTTNLKDDKGRVVKALTALQIRIKYPQFQRYEPGSFNSALYRMKKQVENMANDCESYGSNNGIKQGNNIRHKNLVDQSLRNYINAVHYFLEGIERRKIKIMNDHALPGKMLYHLFLQQ